MSTTHPVTSPRTLVIINERAGAGAMADAFRRFEHPLEDTIGAFELAFTDAPGHGTELAREALLSGVERIIVGGGDGTINEVVNGFVDPATGAPTAPNATLALLGGGTGGDFRKSVGVRDFESALAALRGGRTMALDVGRVTLLGGPDAPEAPGSVRIFNNIASFGFSGQVIRALEGKGGRLVDRYVPALKALGGQAAHFGGTLRAMLDWKNVEVHMTVDERDLGVQRIVTAAIAKGRYFGGGMMIAPDARLDSGHLDITTLGDFGRFEMLGLARHIYAGRHLHHPKVRTDTGRVVVARPMGRDPVLIEIDGELFGQLPARFEVIPAALRLAVP
jgi:diacylglycerol kinase (ATP)